jgi:acetolactate synthase small subunit
MSRPAQSAFHPEAEPTHCFSVHAAAEPGIMPRVLELFAKRGLVPSSWTSRVGAEQDLTIDVQMAGMSAELADYITRCLRQIAGVQVVLASRKRTIVPAAS